MNLSPIATQLIQNGEGYDVVLAVYELVRRHTGMINPARRDPSVKWALATAQKIAENTRANRGSHPGAFDEMESCVYVMASALPSEYQDLWMLDDEETIRELSRRAAEETEKKRKPRALPGNALYPIQP